MNSGPQSKSWTMRIGNLSLPVTALKVYGNKQLAKSLGVPNNPLRRLRDDSMKFAKRSGSSS